MEIPNTHKVPQQIWESFSAEGKLRFNNIMNKAKNNQRAFLHPMAFEMEAYLWDALVYNIACVCVWNEFDLNYKPEHLDAMYSASEKLVRLPRHVDHLGRESDAELV